MSLSLNISPEVLNSLLESIVPRKNHQHLKLKLPCPNWKKCKDFTKLNWPLRHLLIFDLFLLSGQYWQYWNNTGCWKRRGKKKSEKCFTNLITLQLGGQQLVYSRAWMSRSGRWRHRICNGPSFTRLEVNGRAFLIAFFSTVAHCFSYKNFFFRKLLFQVEVKEEI